MWPDGVSNPRPLTYESDALPTALRGPAAGYRGVVRPNTFSKQVPPRKKYMWNVYMMLFLFFFFYCEEKKRNIFKGKTSLLPF